jgi:hypothetical protein
MLESLVLLGWGAALAATIACTRRRGEFLSHPLLIAGLAYGASYFLKPILVRHDARYVVFEQVAGAAPRLHESVLLMGAVGFAALCAGFMIGPAWMVQRPLHLLRWEPRSLRSLTIAAAAWSVLAAASLAWLVARSGVAPSQIHPFSRELRQAILGGIAGSGGPTSLALLLAFFVSLAAWSGTHLQLSRNPRVVRSAFALVAAATLATGLVGSRLWVLSAAIGNLLLFDAFRRRLRPRVVVPALATAAAAGGLLGVALLDTLDPIRSLGAPPVVESAVYRLAGSFDPYEGLVGVLERRPDPLWGLSIAEDLSLTFLPRAIFPWKPEVYGTMRLQEIAFPGMFADFGTRASFPVGLLGEGVANFGLLGVVLLPFAFGTLLRGIRLAELPRCGAAPVLAAFLLGWIAGPLRGLSPVLVHGMLLFGAAMLVGITATAIERLGGSAASSPARLARLIARHGGTPEETTAGRSA